MGEINCGEFAIIKKLEMVGDRSDDLGQQVIGSYRYSVNVVFLEDTRGWAAIDAGDETTLRELVDAQIIEEYLKEL